MTVLKSGFNLFLLLFMLIPGASLMAQNSFFTFDESVNTEADIVPRMAHGEAEFAMTTLEGSVDLLLSGHALLIQFSDSFMDELDEELKSEMAKDEEEPHFAMVIKSMVTSGVKTMLDRAIAIPLSEISEVYYRDGKLYIMNHEGEELFDDLDINDKKVMEDFRGRDARRFVAETEKRMY